MGRKHRRQPTKKPPLREPSEGVLESYPDGDWRVQRITGSSSTKPYRCPGCDQEIRPATPHVVAWPIDIGVDERRHWHTACWSARLRRGPRR